MSERKGGFNLNPPEVSNEELYRRLWLREQNERQWRPIEGEPDTSKAPWDGTAVQLYRPPGGEWSYPYVFSGARNIQEKTWETHPYAHEVDGVTHWMPLPSPEGLE